MTNLTGSEKQIAWAEEIRDQMINGIVTKGTVVCQGTVQSIEFAKSQMDHYEEKAEKKGIDKNDSNGFVWAREDIAFLNTLQEKIETTDNSVWFIDNRKHIAKSILCFARGEK